MFTTTKRSKKIISAAMAAMLMMAALPLSACAEWEAPDESRIISATAENTSYAEAYAYAYAECSSEADPESCAYAYADRSRETKPESYAYAYADSSDETCPEAYAYACAEGSEEYAGDDMALTRPADEGKAPPHEYPPSAGTFTADLIEKIIKHPCPFIKHPQKLPDKHTGEE